MIVRAGAIGFVLLLPACEPAAQPVDTTLPAETTTDANEVTALAPEAISRQADVAETRFPCTGSSCRVVSTDGWAGIRAGMTVAEAARASGFALRQPGHYDEFFSDEPDRLAACNIHGLVGAPENLSVFVEDGVVTSIGVGLDEGRGERFQTDRGVGLGDPEAAVRRAYPRLEEEPDIYSELPDKKLFFRGADGRGIKFSIVGGRVAQINVGGPSINYVEGCL